MRILFLASEFPFPPDSGGRIKTHSLLEYLRARHGLRLLCFRRGPLDARQERWAGDFGNVETIPLLRQRNALNLARSYLSRLPLSVERNRHPLMADAVRRACADASPGAIFCDGWLMAQYVPRNWPGLKILHEHNAEHVLWQRQATMERNPLRRWLVRLESRRVRRYESSILPLFDTVFAVSQQDRAALVAVGGDPARIRILPNLPEPHLLLEPAPSFASSEPLVLYFGTLSWLPNLQGLDYLLRRVWPIVRQAHPEATLAIAGRGAPPGLKRAARSTPGVTYLGPTDDPETLYRRARVFVEATPSGGGTKLKVLNAMARGLPVVASPQAIEGIDAVPNVHVMVGEDAQTLGQAILALLGDPALWQRISENARSLMRDRYTAETAFRPLDEALSGVRHTV